MDRSRRSLAGGRSGGNAIQNRVGSRPFADDDSGQSRRHRDSHVDINATSMLPAGRAVRSVEQTLVMGVRQPRGGTMRCDVLG
jgi:hypothetical protein